MLGLLANVAYHTQLYDIFAENKKILIKDVLLTFLRTSKEELEVMQENPKEFVQLAKDVAD